MEYFDPIKNKIFFGNTNKLIDWIKEIPDQGKIIEKVKLMLKNYLELDNVSFLFGSGTSIHLGAIGIRNFPLEVEEYIKTKEEKIPGILSNFYEIVRTLQSGELKFAKNNLIAGTN